MKSKSFKEDIEYRIYCFKHLGKKYGWRIVSEIGAHLELENIYNDDRQEIKVHLKVKYNPIEIESKLNHPFKGETTLLRKGDLSLKLVEQIFRNPRTHTQKGEYP